MGFLDKVKQQAEQATAKAKDAASDVQTKRELGQAYSELGQKAYELAAAGAVSHPELEAIVERIGSLKAKLEDEGGAEDVATEPETVAAEAAEPAASKQPPAMPS
jgi:hypothetical protein